MFNVRRSDTPHSVEVLRMRDRSVADTSTRLHILITRQTDMPPAGFETAVPSTTTRPLGSALLLLLLLLLPLLLLLLLLILPLLKK